MSSVFVLRLFAKLATDFPGYAKAGTPTNTTFLLVEVSATVVY